MIKITFPDGAVREFESGVTTFEIAQSISNSLAKKALAGKFNGKLIDTTRAITEDGSIEIVTPDHEDALPILRHSAAHLFAQAARRLFPDIHLGVGPAIEDGFYYDTDNQAGQISNEDLPRIEEEMKKIVKENFPSIREEVTKDEAREIFKNDPYKLELIEEHSEDEGGLTIYRQGEYVDLCRGPHVPSTGRIPVSYTHLDVYKRQALAVLTPKTANESKTDATPTVNLRMEKRCLESPNRLFMILSSHYYKS